MMAEATEAQHPAFPKMPPKTDIDLLREEIAHVHECVELVKTALLGDLKTKEPGMLFEHEQMKKVVKRIDRVWWKMYGAAMVVSAASPLVFKWISENLLAKHP